ITREQMAVMIVKAAQLQTSNGELEFADRDQISSWAADAIAAAVQNQLISGYPDNTFRPGQGASRAEAVTVILKALKLGKA
ncbi:MAG TPA: S-layer homology domain-containing protein, partial [Syntrophomonadaceae bacterium]|nr:S-layer homology domain-containing protein [Syntrophomonadaceae bacterium]